MERILTVRRLIYTLKHSLAWAVYPTGENNKGVIPCWRRSATGGARGVLGLVVMGGI